VNVRHRQVHRLLWPVLLPVLGAAVTVGLAVRAKPPPMDLLPSALAPLPPPEGQPLSVQEQDGLRVALYPDLLEVSVLEPLREPDPSLWLTSSPPQGGLPSGAVLLGLLPEQGVLRVAMPHTRGHLVVFSLADGQILSTLSLGGS
jgi:hypothetical protein